MAQKPKNYAELTCSGPEACELLECSRQWLDKLVADGWIERRAKNTYGVVNVLKGYNAFLKDSLHRGTKNEADTRLREARAYDQEIKTAERVGRLIDVEDHFYCQTTLAGFMVSEALGFSARITRDLPLRRTIDREMNALLGRVADKQAELGREFESGRAYPAVATNSAAGRVGSAQQIVPENRRDPRPA